MRRLIGILLLTLAAGVRAALLPVTPYTVVARVDSYEYYRAKAGGWGAERFGPSAPWGNERTVVATILFPDSLAGREIAIPFESRHEGKELFVQRGTVFRFEYQANLADLRSRTDRVYRSAIDFPALGVIVLKPTGEVAEAYPGPWTARHATAAEKQTQGTR